MSCCKRDGEEGSTLTRDLLVLGVSLGASFALLLAAGIKYNNWIPMLNLGAVVFVPMAVILSETLGGGSIYGSGYDETKATFTNLGSCFFGTVLVSLLGLPLVLLHVGAIAGEPFGLWIGSTALTFVAAVWYWVVRQRQRMSM